MRFLNGVFILLLVLAYSTFAETALPSIAVVDMTGDISTSESRVLTDKLMSFLGATGKFQIFERSMVSEILKEQGFQQTVCTDQSCAVEMGQLLGVQKMCMGTVGKIGSTYSITLRIVNVATGQIERTSSFDIKGSVEDVLYKGVSGAVQKLLENEVANKPEVQTTKQELVGSKEKKSIVKPLAIVSTAICLAGAGGATFFWIDKSRIHSEYLAQINPDVMNEKITEEESAYLNALVFTGVSAVLLPVSAILWIKNKKEKSNKVTIIPAVSPSGLSMNIIGKF